MITLSQLSDILVEILGCERRDIALDVTLDELGADSLDTIDLAFACEEEFGIKIHEDIQFCDTVGKWLDFLNSDRCK